MSSHIAFRNHVNDAGSALYQAWSNGDLIAKRTVIMQIVSAACDTARRHGRTESDILAMRHQLASQLCKEYDDRIMASASSRR